MGKQLYCAIIGDINKSRSLKNRDKIQNAFHGAIGVINREFRNDISAKFLITLGDEFQGLLKSARMSYQCVRRIQEIMDPVHFTFGVGIGTISTAFKANPTAMDGEVFHRARKALEDSKERRSLVRFEFDHSACSLANATADLLDKHWCRLTARQRLIAELMKKHRSQSSVARVLKISQPSVWKVVASQHLRQVEEAEAALNSFLASLMAK